MSTSLYPIQIAKSLSLELGETVGARAFFELVEAEREGLGEWFDWPEKVRDVEDAALFLRHAQVFTRGGQQYLLFLRYEERLAGSVGLVRIDKKNQTAELGYWLRSDLQGKGLITSACQWLVGKAFEDLELYRLELKIAEQNKGSIRTASKLGFKKEGILRSALYRNGVRKDLLLYSLLKKEWKLKNK